MAHNNAIEARASRARTGTPSSGGAPVAHGKRYAANAFAKETTNENLASIRVHGNAITPSRRGRRLDKKQVVAELAKLQGTWRIVSYEKDGVELPPDQLKDLPVVTFKARDYTWSFGARPGTITKIDPSQTPRTIDYKITDGPDKGKTELSIYELVAIPSKIASLLPIPTAPRSSSPSAELDTR